MTLVLKICTQVPSCLQISSQLLSVCERVGILGTVGDSPFTEAGKTEREWICGKAGCSGLLGRWVLYCGVSRREIQARCGNL